MPGMPTGSSHGGVEGSKSPLQGGQKRAGEPGTASGWGGSLRGLAQPDRRSRRDTRAGRRLPGRVRVEEKLDKALLSPATASGTAAPGPRCEHAALPQPPQRRVPREPRAAAAALTGLLSGLRQSRAYGAGSRGEGGRAAPGASGERGLIWARGRPAWLAHGPCATSGQGRWCCRGVGDEHGHRVPRDRDPPESKGCSSAGGLPVQPGSCDRHPGRPAGAEWSNRQI